MRWLCPCLVVLMACGAGGLEGNVYRGEGFAFRFERPENGWKRIEVTSAPVAYRSDASRSTMMINARCGTKSKDVPLQALHNHLFMMFTEREVHVQEVVPFNEREALHTEMSAKLDGVPMRYDSWILKKDGCVYDLLYMAPPESYQQGHGTFRELVKGFTTVDEDE